MSWKALPHQKIAVLSERLDAFLKGQNLTSVDLLKMDIEGAEIEVLDSCSDDLLQSVSQMTVEFHDFNGMASLEDVSRVVRRLKGLGFLCFVMSRATHDDVCFVNRNRCPISTTEALWV
jgi:hypothetical protein